MALWGKEGGSGQNPTQGGGSGPSLTQGGGLGRVCNSGKGARAECDLDMCCMFADTGIVWRYTFGNFKAFEVD